MSVKDENIKVHFFNKKSLKGQLTVPFHLFVDFWICQHLRNTDWGSNGKTNIHYSEKCFFGIEENVAVYKRGGERKDGQKMRGGGNK